MKKTKETASIDHARGHMSAVRTVLGGSPETKKAFLRDHVSKMSPHHLHHTLRYISPGAEASPHMSRADLISAITFALQGITVPVAQSARDRAVNRYVKDVNQDWSRSDDFILDIMKIAEDTAIRREEMLKIIQGVKHVSNDAKKRAEAMNKSAMMSLLMGEWKKLYLKGTLVRFDNSEKKLGHLRLLFGHGGTV